MTWQNGKKQQLLKPGDNWGRFTLVRPNRKHETYIAFRHSIYGGYMVVCRVDYADKWLSYWLFRDATKLESSRRKP